LHARLGNEMGAVLIKREEMIDKLEKANRTLQEQLETARDAHKHWQRSYNTVEIRLCIAKQARMKLERDLQSWSTHLGEELEQATKTKEEALKGMISIKNNLVNRLLWNSD
jgi:predicted  nucleic acid-binding Zn-ribbon protein